MKVQRLLLVVLALAGATVPLCAQETPPGTPDPGVREVQAAQDQLARAIAEFDGPNQSRSIVLFDDIIGRLEGVQRQSGFQISIFDERSRGDSSKPRLERVVVAD